MPLCPTCICSHLELHLKGGKSSPVFDNINDSFSACSKEIKVFSEKFEEGRNQLVSIRIFRMVLRELSLNKRNNCQS